MSKAFDQNTVIKLNRFIDLHVYFKKNSYDFLAKKLLDKENKDINEKNRLAEENQKKLADIERKKQALIKKQEDTAAKLREKEEREEKERLLVLKQKQEQEALEAQAREKEEKELAKEKEREREKQEQELAKKAAAEAEATKKRLAAEELALQQKKEIEHLADLKKQKQALITQATELIDSGLYDTLFLIIQKGYTLDEAQQSKMSSVFEELLNNELINHYENDNNENHRYKEHKIESWLSQGWTISDEHIISLLFTPSFQEKYNLNLFSYQIIDSHPLLSIQIIDKLQQFEFQQLFFNTWKQQLSLTDGFNTVDQASLPFIVNHHHEYLFKHIDTVDEFIQLCALYSTNLNRIYNSYLDINIDHAFFENEMQQQTQDVTSHVHFMNGLIELYFPHGLQNILNKTSLLFCKENIEKHISMNNKINIEQINLENLPLKATEIMNKFYNIYPELYQNLSFLDSEHQEKINILFTQTLPHIFNLYFAVPESSRNSLFNHQGQSIEDSMIHDLESVYKEFHQIFVHITKKSKTLT